MRLFTNYKANTSFEYSTTWIQKKRNVSVAELNESRKKVLFQKLKNSQIVHTPSPAKKKFCYVFFPIPIFPRLSFDYYYFLLQLWHHMTGLLTI